MVRRGKNPAKNRLRALELQYINRVHVACECAMQREAVFDSHSSRHKALGRGMRSTQGEISLNGDAIERSASEVESEIRSRHDERPAYNPAKAAERKVPGIGDEAERPPSIVHAADDRNTARVAQVDDVIAGESAAQCKI